MLLHSAYFVNKPIPSVDAIYNNLKYILSLLTVILSLSPPTAYNNTTHTQNTTYLSLHYYYCTNYWFTELLIAPVLNNLTIILRMLHIFHVILFSDTTEIYHNTSARAANCCTTEGFLPFFNHIPSKKTYFRNNNSRLNCLLIVCYHCLSLIFTCQTRRDSCVGMEFHFYIP